VLNSLYYARAYIQGAFGGVGGVSGQSGSSGSGGARGEWEGGCHGGGRGPTPATPATPIVKAPNGADTSRGRITQQVDNNVDRFFTA
jgi:hypothetical protein